MNKKMNDEGVSPVIGVILMVAITVVLAAIVFILVSRLSAAPNAPIEIGVFHNQDNSFTISSIIEHITWSNVTIKDNGGVQVFTINGVSPPVGSLISPGDIIRITGLTTGSHNVSMITRGTVFYQVSFVV